MSVELKNRTVEKEVEHETDVTLVSGVSGERVEKFKSDHDRERLENIDGKRSEEVEEEKGEKVRG